MNIRTQRTRYSTEQWKRKLEEECNVKLKDETKKIRLELGNKFQQRMDLQNEDEIDSKSEVGTFIDVKNIKVESEYTDSEFTDVPCLWDKPSREVEDDCRNGSDTSNGQASGASTSSRGERYTDRSRRDYNDILIQEVRSHRRLWDSSSRKYRNNFDRHRAWIAIEKTMTEANVKNPSMQFAKARWESLRGTYRTEVKKIKSSQKSGSSTEDIYEPSWAYFDSMDFLRPVIDGTKNSNARMDSSEDEIDSKNEVETFHDVKDIKVESEYTDSEFTDVPCLWDKPPREVEDDCRNGSDTSNGQGPSAASTSRGPSRRSSVLISEGYSDQSRKDYNDILIQGVQFHRCLWDINSKKYKNKVARHRAWLDIERTMKNANAKNPTMKYAKARWETLRGSYRLEAKKMKNSHKNMASTDGIYKPTWAYFDSLDFLRTVIDGARNSNPVMDASEVLSLQMSDNSQHSFAGGPGPGPSFESSQPSLGGPGPSTSLEFSQPSFVGGPVQIPAQDMAHQHPLGGDPRAHQESIPRDNYFISASPSPSPGVNTQTQTPFLYDSTMSQASGRQPLASHHPVADGNTRHQPPTPSLPNRRRASGKTPAKPPVATAGQSSITDSAFRERLYSVMGTLANKMELQSGSSSSGSSPSRVGPSGIGNKDELMDKFCRYVRRTTANFKDMKITSNREEVLDMARALYNLSHKLLDDEEVAERASRRRRGSSPRTPRASSPQVPLMVQSFLQPVPESNAPLDDSIERATTITSAFGKGGLEMNLPDTSGMGNEEETEQADAERQFQNL